MRKYVFMSAAVLALLFSGCGGGGGGTTSSSSISGTVNASSLKGVKVCTEDETVCSTTDKSGHFVLNNVTPPVTLKLKIGDSTFGQVKASSTSIKITPLRLADNNTTVASYIGALLHEIAGCGFTKTQCDLSSVRSLDINASDDKPLVEEIKDALSINSQQIRYTVNGNTKTITENNATLYQTSNPDMVSSNVSFSGAASVGDFANFTYDKKTKTISYSIKGNVFGDKNGTREIESLYHNVFFKDKDSDTSYFFSGSLGVALIPVTDTNISYVVGLQMPEIDEINASLIANKTFNYMEFNTNGSINFGLIDINSTSDTNGTWTDKVSGITGTWKVSRTHIDVYNNNTKIANIIIRPGSSRAGFIIDKVNGGFGIGVEAKELNASELSGTFYYYDNSPDGTECFGTVDINRTNFSYKDEYCSDNSPDNGSGTLNLNPPVTIDGRSFTLNGIAQETNSSKYVFIDPTDGYYIAVDINDSDIAIGSNKPLE